MQDLTLLPDFQRQALRGTCSARLESLRNYRLSWWTHWSELAAVFLPRRYRYFITPNQYSKGAAINGQIVDETGVLAARTLATGLLANLTSPTKPWFRLGLMGIDIPDEGPVAEWLATCTTILFDIYANSNLYNALGTAYHDLVVFGSASLIQYDDDEDLVRFYVPCMGEFFFGLDNRLTVDTTDREYTYTVKECVDEFGLENCSPSVQNSYRSGGTDWDLEITVCHCIEPNTDVYYSGVNHGLPVPSIFPYREVYWERGDNGGAGQGILRLAGFREKPFVGLRWDVTSNDAYGRSPGMDALPAVRQLQIEQRRKAEAIDKMVRPPMVASVAMRNEPMSILPGDISYVADPSANGFKPAFTVEPRISEMMEDLKEVQDRVRVIMFNPLFTGITDISKVQTATYIEAVEQEKLVMLGPVVERIENEGLKDIIFRTFSIARRRGALPPPPPELNGATIDVSFISILAEAQRASAIAGIERTFQFAGGLVGVWPQSGDNLDADAAILKYADLLNDPPDIIHSRDQVAAIRQERDQVARAQAAMAVGQNLAKGAQTLSQTDMGDGTNALQTLTGGSVQ